MGCLTWQLPQLPVEADAADWTTRTQARTRQAVRLAEEHTKDGGSVLVFCGSKPAVRATALALAASRGVDTSTADPDDHEQVERLCTKTGIRIHYRDWPYKRDAERAFRDRKADILVATSTVAAGVNLPARAVIVRDTRIGLEPIEVSMVQQMFGRAGRIGAGEREGFAYLLTAPSERHTWQHLLAAGYTVTSSIRERLPDHLLAEAVQGRLTTLHDARHWWTQTFACHQGDHDLEPLHHAAGQLTAAGYLRPVPDNDAQLHVTDLGKLTSRLMVQADHTATLARALHHAPVPDDPDTAEDQLLTTLATHLPTLQQAPFTDTAKTALLNALRAIDPNTAAQRSGSTSADAKPTPTDLARAVLLLVARKPKAFRSTTFVLGIPATTMAPILDEAQRYLAWLGAQGPLRTIHPWVAVTAHDLAQRLRWRTLGPDRGSGRLLAVCEQMATPARAPELVPAMWRAARARGIDAPDWAGRTPPHNCQLPADVYQALLDSRTTGTEITPVPAGLRIRAPQGAQICLWNGAATTWMSGTGAAHDLSYPQNEAPCPPNYRVGAAVFTRNDRLGEGWLAAYSGLAANTRTDDVRG